MITYIVMCSSIILLSPRLYPPATPSAVSSCYHRQCSLHHVPSFCCTCVGDCSSILLLSPRLYPPATPAAVSSCYHRQCSLHHVPSFHCCCSHSSHLLPPTACFFVEFSNAPYPRVLCNHSIYVQLKNLGS